MTHAVLVHVLERFVGRQCSGFTAGEGTGSVVALDFEPRVPRRRPLSNPTLSLEQRLTEAEYSVFVLCVWRLDAETEVICGAWDDNSPEGPMLSGLRRLAGRTLEGFHLSRPGLDLDLHFEGSLCFRIFCDQVNEADQSDNYSLFLPGEILIVSTRSRLSREER